MVEWLYQSKVGFGSNPKVISLQIFGLYLQAFALEICEIMKVRWRVWSLLRMNAGGMLNTCKSNDFYSDGRVSNV